MSKRGPSGINASAWERAVAKRICVTGTMLVLRNEYWRMRHKLKDMWLPEDRTCIFENIAERTLLMQQQQRIVAWYCLRLRLGRDVACYLVDTQLRGWTSPQLRKRMIRTFGSSTDHIFCSEHWGGE